MIAILEHALRRCIDEGLLPAEDIPFIEVEATKEAAHGDYASNIAMMLASRAGRRPRQIAELLVSHIDESDSSS